MGVGYREPIWGLLIVSRSGGCAALGVVGVARGDPAGDFIVNSWFGYGSSLVERWVAKGKQSRAVTVCMMRGE